MEERVVAINFCGGCNQIIDRGDIALEIKDTLAAEGFVVVFNDWNTNFIVRLSGCQANCASAYHPVDRPDAVISGRAFAAVAVDESELAGRAIAAVRAHFRAAAASTAPARTEESR